MKKGTTTAKKMTLSASQGFVAIAYSNCAILPFSRGFSRT